MFSVRFFLFVGLLLSPAAQANPWITEFMADSAAGILPGIKDDSDWIEIYNAGDEPLELEGYCLTDDADELSKWRFPKLTLAGRTFGIVLASGEKGEPVQSAETFVAFSDLKLDPKGEFLALVKPDGKTVVHAFQPRFPEQRSGVSYGLPRAGKGMDLAEIKPSYLRRATPMTGNSEGVEGFANPVYASQGRGFYSEPLEVALSTTTPQGQIRYTTDGSPPTETTGQVYDKPISIKTTTTLRAAAFRDGWQPSVVLTNTFFFVSDVVRQCPNGEAPEGWNIQHDFLRGIFRGRRLQQLPQADTVEQTPQDPPQTGPFNVNGQILDFGMDPDIVGGEHTVEEVEQSLLSLPAISIVAALDDLFSPARGVYVNAYNRGPQWERPVSLELIHPDGRRGFQIDAGLRVRGGFSRRGDNPKHALRVLFKKKYGEGKLRYPLFEDEGAKDFDKIDFTSSLNYSWAMDGGNQDALIRDVFCRDTQRAMGQPYTRSRFYHLYINGHYWGIYVSQERVGEDYGATYLGGKETDYDVVKTFGKLSAGNTEAHNRFFEIARAGFEDDATYFAAQGLRPDGSPDPSKERLLDVDNLIDYMIITFYSGNRDGPGGRFANGPNNFYALYNRVKPDGWKFFAHDMEHALDRGDEDMTFPPVELSDNPNWFNCHALHDRLTANAKYRKRFEERVEKHLFGKGALSVESALARLDARAKEIDKAILAYSARWGDAKSGSPRTYEDWKRCVDEIREWMRGRNNVVLGQFIERGWYKGTAMPVTLALPDGRRFLRAKEGGEIHYTTDGSDPKGENDGPSTTAKLAREPKVVTRTWMPETAKTLYWIPTNGDSDQTWFRRDFDASAWTEAEQPIGYDEDGQFRGLRTDISQEFRNQSNTVYLRYDFTVDDPKPGDMVNLAVKYDDGFLAYLNGHEVARANAPGRLDWKAKAPGKIREQAGYVSFSVPNEALQSVKKGRNVLAIQGLNESFGSSDFYIQAKMDSTHLSGGETVPVGATARTFKDGKWSPAIVVE